jgi:hypothetical protein
MLNRKKRRDEKEQYLTAQKLVKNYREKQKSYSAFKRKVNNDRKTFNSYMADKEGTAVAVIRISG